MEIKTGQKRRADGDMSERSKEHTNSDGATRKGNKNLKAEGSRHKGVRINNVKAESRKGARMEHGLNSVNVLRKVGFLFYAGTSEASHMGGAIAFIHNNYYPKLTQKKGYAENEIEL